MRAAESSLPHNRRIVWRTTDAKLRASVAEMLAKTPEPPEVYIRAATTHSPLARGRPRKPLLASNDPANRRALPTSRQPAGDHPEPAAGGRRARGTSDAVELYGG